MMKTVSTSIETGLGWHFSLGHVGYPNFRKIAAGVTHTADVEPVLGESGLHDSMRIIDALRRAPGHVPGPVLARTSLGGAVAQDNGTRCGTERTYLAVIDASAILHKFACRCAERAARTGNPDPRSVAAIGAKRAWLRGEITDEHLAAARGAAWDVDPGSGWFSIAPPTRAAAWAAAWAADSCATRAAVNAAAWAVDSAECEWQNDELTRIALESLAEVGYTEEQAAQ